MEGRVDTEAEGSKGEDEPGSNVLNSLVRWIVGIKCGIFFFFFCGSFVPYDFK